MDHRFYLKLFLIGVKYRNTSIAPSIATFKSIKAVSNGPIIIGPLTKVINKPGHWFPKIIFINLNIPRLPLHEFPRDDTVHVTLRSAFFSEG